MKLSTIIPDYLLLDHNLLVVYCYFLRQVQPIQTKQIVKSSIITLRPYEVCVVPDRVALELEMETAIVEEQIQKLIDLELVEYSCENELVKIKFKYLVLHQVDQNDKKETITGMNDCWFDEFIIEYLEFVKTNMSPKTHINYEGTLNAFNKWLGRKKLSELSPADLEKYKNHKKGSISDHTINIHIRTLKAALELAKKWGKVKENPFRVVKLIRTPKKSTPSLSKEEFILLRSKIREKWLIDIIDFDVLTGLRLGELVDLRWSNIDLEKGIITIHSSPDYQVKHGKMRILPLHSEAKSILVNKEKIDEFVFLKDDGTRPPCQFISKKFKSYIREAGLSEEYHFHSLRATFASWCANEGVSLYTLQNLMGHSSIKVTESYTSPDYLNLKRELSKISVLTTLENA